MRNFSLRNLDALEFLRGLKPLSIDLLITDPPYASLDKHRSIGTTTRLRAGWFETVPNEYFVQFFVEAYRVLRDNSHAYVLVDSETMFHIKPMAESAGFRFWKPIVWDKVSIGMGYHYRNTYEFILFFEKGKRNLNDLGVSDILRHKRVRGEYPTEKPVELLKTLVLQSSEERQIVADPFAGSGSTGVAALSCNRRFVGSDKSEVAFKLAEGRLSEWA